MHRTCFNIGATLKIKNSIKGAKLTQNCNPKFDGFIKKKSPLPDPNQREGAILKRRPPF